MKWDEAAELAPGDQGCRTFDWSGFEIERIGSTAHPRFAEAYDRLWTEFGTKGELETREVLARRMQWNPREPHDGVSLLYEMIVVRKDGRLAAVRDHTAIVSGEGAAATAVVHLSHVLVDQTFRGSGMIGWLRAWPIKAAKACLASAVDSRRVSPAGAGHITLVAEMEPPVEGAVDALERPSLDAPARLIRLKSYSRAGFSRVDPKRVDYRQPDFRPPAEIDAAGGASPLPLQLIVRRVGRENEKIIAGAEVRRIVDSLYRMYGVEFRARDMAPVWEQLRAGYPADGEVIALLDPVPTSERGAP